MRPRGLGRPTRLLDTGLSACRGPAHAGRRRGPRVKHEPDVAQHAPGQRKVGRPKPMAPGSERPWAGPISQKRLLELNSELLSCRGSLQGGASPPPTHSPWEPAQLPSHFCLRPNPDASGQALRSPASPVSVPLLPRSQVRVVLNHPCYISQTRSTKRPVPGDAPRSCHPHPAPPLSNRKLLSPRDTRPASGRARPGPQRRGSCVPWPRDPGIQHPPWAARDGGEPRPPGAGPGPPCASLWPEVDVGCSSPCAAAADGPALALTRHRGSAGTRGPGQPPLSGWVTSQLNPHGPGG